MLLSDFTSGRVITGLGPLISLQAARDGLCLRPVMTQIVGFRIVMRGLDPRICRLKGDGLAGTIDAYYQFSEDIRERRSERRSA